MKRLPEKTSERLSEYRRTLLKCLAKGKTHIYSHEIAQKHNITAVQVRRDIMLIGYSSMQRKGYDIRELVNVIGHILDTENGQNVAVVGMGNLGRAITTYFNGKRPKLNIVAGFDSDPNKTDRMISGVFCYPVRQLEQVIKEKNISVGIITVSSDQAPTVAEALVISGIKGILNFTSASLSISPYVYLEEYNMITSIEKVAYFVKLQEIPNQVSI